MRMISVITKANVAPRIPFPLNMKPCPLGVLLNVPASVTFVPFPPEYKGVFFTKTPCHLYWSLYCSLVTSVKRALFALIHA